MRSQERHGYGYGTEQKRRVRRPLITVGAALLFLAGSAVVGGYFLSRSGNDQEVTPTEDIATPTPSQAAGEPTITPTEIAPIETEVVRVPNLGVRYDPRTEECVLVDRATGKVVDVSNASPIKRISYRETGVGKVLSITTTLKPGQTAVRQGYLINNVSGLFEATINSGAEKIILRDRIVDGSVTVVDSQDGPSAFCNAVDMAIGNGWAHGNVNVPKEWKIN